MAKQNSLNYVNDLLKDYEKLNSIANYLFGLSKDTRKDDRLALIIVYAAAEMILDFLLGVLCKHGSMALKKNPPFMGKVILLEEMEVIDEKLFNNLRALQTLRNFAAHKPANDVNWKGKFAFNKDSDIYKKFVEDFGEPPQDLMGNIFCVWNDLYMMGSRACTRRRLKWTKNTKAEQKE